MSEEGYTTFGDSDYKKSKFHSGISQLYRLDSIWQKTHSDAVAVNYIKWNEHLDRIWAELGSDAPQEKKSFNYANKMKELNEKLIKTGLYGLNAMLRKTNPVLYSKVILAQKEILLEKELLLRKLQNEEGKGTAYEQSIEDTIGQL